MSKLIKSHNLCKNIKSRRSHWVNNVTILLPPILYTSCNGKRRGLPVGLSGGRMLSRALKRVLPLALPCFRSIDHPLNQGICKKRTFPFLIHILKSSVNDFQCHFELPKKNICVDVNVKSNGSALSTITLLNK